MAATADGQEILQRVVRQGKRLRDMVEQLLQASAFVANRSPVLRAEGVEVVAEVVDDWRLAEPDRRAELSLPDRPRSLQGDAEALRMVVGNLVDNAGKHAPPGTPVRVQVSQPAGLTRIEVTDQGEGVAEIDRERIFAPFTQLDASTTRRVGGVGLGLFLVDRLVRAWAAGSGWRTTRAAGPGSWSSCPTWPRCRRPPGPGTARPPRASTTRPGGRHRHGQGRGRARLPAPGRRRRGLRPAGRGRAGPAAAGRPGGRDRAGRARPAQHLPAGRTAGGGRDRARPLAWRRPGLSPGPGP
jgi:hypothetical protein